MMIEAKTAVCEFVAAYVPAASRDAKCLCFSGISVVQAATTRLMCSIVESLKLGVLQRSRFLAQAQQDFAGSTDNAGPSATLHPLLFLFLKIK